MPLIPQIGYSFFKLLINVGQSRPTRDLGSDIYRVYEGLLSELRTQTRPSPFHAYLSKVASHCIIDSTTMDESASFTHPETVGALAIVHHRVEELVEVLSPTPYTYQSSWPEEHADDLVQILCLGTPRACTAMGNCCFLF